MEQIQYYLWGNNSKVIREEELFLELCKGGGGVEKRPGKKWLKVMEEVVTKVI
jgi:uncharacterized protein YifE (UPF0438 family)